MSWHVFFRYSFYYVIILLIFFSSIPTRKTFPSGTAPKRDGEKSSCRGDRVFIKAIKDFRATLKRPAVVRSIIFFFFRTFYFFFSIAARRMEKSPRRRFDKKKIKKYIM